jgi:hypothetical protein
MTDDCPEYYANILHAYADLDWATCPKTRRSFGGAVGAWLGARLRTSVNSNLQLRDLPPKRSSWQHMTQEK